jgi:hypothetical protein
VDLEHSMDDGYSTETGILSSRSSVPMFTVENIRRGTYNQARFCNEGVGGLTGSLCLDVVRDPSRVAG